MLVVLSGCGGESQRSLAEAGGSTGSSGTSGTSGTSGGSGSGGASGIDPGCDNGTERNSDDERVLGIALEAASLAPADRMVQLSIGLVDPEFDFTRLQNAGSEENHQAIIDERIAQLAPTQDAIEERLLARGAVNVSRNWLVNVMDAELEARYVKEVPCWPTVVRVELGDAYWEVVDPPWDSSIVGTDACPRYGEGCTAHCAEIRGTCLDAAHACLKLPEVVTCNRWENSFNESPGCSVRPDTGETCSYGSLVPTDPGYAGFIPCTDAEKEMIGAAPFCER